MNEQWQKSTHSGGSSNACVECRTDAGQVLIRDTQHRHLGCLSVPVDEWRVFLTALCSDEVD